MPYDHPAPLTQRFVSSKTTTSRHDNDDSLAQISLVSILCSVFHIMPRSHGKRDKRTGARKRRHRHCRDARESSNEQDSETSGKDDDSDDDDGSYSDGGNSDEIRKASGSRRKPHRSRKDKTNPKEPDK